jgi:hypothetical protein
MIENVFLAGMHGAGPVVAEPARTPTKAAAMRFELKLDEHHESHTSAHLPNSLQVGAALNGPSDAWSRFADMGTKFNDDYKKQSDEALQNMLDLDPSDPYFVIRATEFSIGFANANFRLTMVANLGDSAKHTMSTLLKNQG